MNFLFRMLVVIGCVWLVSRGSIFLLPGDPVDYLLEESLIQTTDLRTIENIRSQLDLDQGFWSRLTHLPSATSIISGKEIAPLIISSLKNSFILSILTLSFTLILTGFALYQGFQSKTLSRFFDGLSILLASVPVFISGPALLYFFSLTLDLFPVTHHPFLPAVALSIYLTGFWYRSLKQKIEDYLPVSAASGARARGLGETRVFFSYILAPCLGSMIRFFLSQVGNLLNGSLIVELIFQWPGLGFLLSDSIHKRDYPLIESGLFLVSLITLMSLQIGKWLQYRLEPRQT